MSTTPVADLIEQMFMQRVAAMKEKDEGLRDFHLKSMKVTKVRLEAALKREPKAKIEAIEVPLPAWVPQIEWNGYVEMRASKKRPLTPRGIQIALAKLQELRDQGESIGAVLDNSTVNGWIGLFPAKEGNKMDKEFIV